MRGHVKGRIFDMMLALVAYLIFAVSLVAVNMVKYPDIKNGFYALLLTSGILMYYSVHNFNKGLK